MKKLALVALALFAASPALAISRYNTLSMSCARVQATLEREGAAILRYPSPRVKGLTLYDRYVRDTNQCEPDKYAETSTVPTSDDPSCDVYVCKRRERDNCFSMFGDCGFR